MNTRYPFLRPILVFDVDNTLAGEYTKDHAKIVINEKLADLIQNSIGFVDGIFVLTNNADIPYVLAVLERIASRVGKPVQEVFRDVMVRQDYRRYEGPGNNPPGNPEKRLRDVERMALDSRVSPVDLANRVLFFDDLPDHVLKSELPAGRYIHIEPPFTQNGQEDKTNYGKVFTDLGLLLGGRRRLRLSRKGPTTRKYNRKLTKKSAKLPTRRRGRA